MRWLQAVLTWETDPPTGALSPESVLPIDDVIGQHRATDIGIIHKANDFARIQMTEADSHHQFLVLQDVIQFAQSEFGRKTHQIPSARDHCPATGDSQTWRRVEQHQAEYQGRHGHGGDLRDQPSGLQLGDHLLLAQQCRAVGGGF